MTLATALYEYLAAQPAITALTADRIYQVWMPQRPQGAALEPTLVYRLVSRQDEAALDGAVMAITRWEFAALSESYDSAHELAEALIASLNYFRGQMGSAPGVQVKSVQLEDALDDDAVELGVFVVIVQFQIKHI